MPTPTTAAEASARARLRRRLRAVTTDIRPLQASADYRRLWFGSTVSQLGQQMTTVAVAIQVYDLTGSSFAVGLVGLFSLVPLVVFGVYGGAIADAVDRRRLALAASTGLWLLSVALLVHALLSLESVGVLYGIVALQGGCYAVNSPARSAIIPRLLPADLLPAANALSSASFNLGFTVGPVVGAFLIAWQGYAAAYAVDVVTFTAALYALLRLPPVPPQGDVRRAGLASVREGLRFLRQAPNLRMSFVADLCAMVFAQPRALFPALAVLAFGSTGAVGLMQGAPAAGALLAFAVSGWISRVHRHGLAIVAAVVLYGAAVAAVGFAGALWVALAFLALSGAADMVSAAYRLTILQTAAPDALRGRLQGVFIVVVAGGPRLGEFVLGSLASVVGERAALVTGGATCMVAVVAAGLLQRRFLRYDARDPEP
ncbi:MAG: MFS transporter [Actinomycetota bacterium]|nr:MFS transporter [Actinomycetota bacterium]